MDQDWKWESYDEVFDFEWSIDPKKKEIESIIKNAFPTSLNEELKNKYLKEIMINLGKSGVSSMKELCYVFENWEEIKIWPLFIQKRMYQNVKVLMYRLLSVTIKYIKRRYVKYCLFIKEKSIDSVFLWNKFACSVPRIIGVRMRPQTRNFVEKLEKERIKSQKKQGVFDGLNNEQMKEGTFVFYPKKLHKKSSFFEGLWKNSKKELKKLKPKEEYFFIIPKVCLISREYRDMFNVESIFDDSDDESDSDSDSDVDMDKSKRESEKTNDSDSDEKMKENETFNNLMDLYFATSKVARDEKIGVKRKITFNEIWTLSAVIIYSCGEVKRKENNRGEYFPIFKDMGEVIVTIARIFSNAIQTSHSSVLLKCCKNLGLKYKEGVFSETLKALTQSLLKFNMKRTPFFRKQLKELFRFVDRKRHSEELCLIVLSCASWQRISTLLEQLTNLLKPGSGNIGYFSKFFREKILEIKNEGNKVHESQTLKNNDVKMKDNEI